MAKVDTWMPIYWGDYAKDTGHLGAVHHGAYLMLIKHYWVTGGRLPADDSQLWRIACCDSLAHWRKIKAVILAFFEERDGRLRHARIDKELASAEGNAERRTEMARRAAEARWGKERKSERPDARRNAPGIARRMPGALPTECPPPSPSDSSHGDVQPVSGRAAASPDGPPRAQLPDAGRWADRLNSYRPWLPFGDPLRGRWPGSWGLPPDSAGTNPSIPSGLLSAWRANFDAEMEKLRSAA